MRWVFIGAVWFVVLVAIPLYVNWLRHRPRRLAAGTQHIALAGLVVQFTLVVLALFFLVLW